jgi:hypothetical protein
MNEATDDAKQSMDMNIEPDVNTLLTCEVPEEMVQHYAAILYRTSYPKKLSKTLATQNICNIECNNQCHVMRGLSHHLHWKCRESNPLLVIHMVA